MTSSDRGRRVPYVDRRPVFTLYVKMCQALADPRSGVSDQLRKEAASGVLTMRKALQAYDAMVTLAEIHAYDERPAT